MFNKINLQLFAYGGGEVVNTTVGYTNAYTGEVTAFAVADTYTLELTRDEVPNLFIQLDDGLTREQVIALINKMTAPSIK